ncbi:MAG: hypothetical protein A2Z11_02960 [Candidatus Woykebacteria bacterium RBG_16_43_9]|uniref:Methylaspartate mutase n=1 Tax=Candidatus Woykebacteria bacterium RBG_16_43_9 TaxID=1802596 RepID=A0A1G1WC72_9BACT|nr:MAG: hypothetical protein A2Z11_02960 [Candidatus Woykebacteria bacterium RBG_16_43_9]
MPEQKFLTIDIGSAWTKAFLVNIDSENNVNIEQTYRLPTSWGDFSIATKLLRNQIPSGEATKLFVSHLPEVEGLAKKEGGEFVKEQDAAEALVKFLKKSDTNVSILDGGASNLHERTQAEDVGKYLTFASSAIFLENIIGKKKFKPHLLPTDTKELEIEEAFLRTTFSEKLSKQAINKKILIAATGGMISGSPRLSRIALLILDILGSGSVAQVIFDREFFLPSFGALLSKYKQLQMSTPGQWLEELGTLASLGGSQKLDLDWGYSQLQQVELSEGEISLIPAPKEQKIKLTLSHSNKEKRDYDIVGGSLGIVLDARSKPPPLVFGQAQSRKNMTTWLKELERAEINKEAF